MKKMSSALLADALTWARKQQVVLPTEYYGLLQGRARAAAFTIAGISVLDQIERVKVSLEKATGQGWSFAKWKRAVAAGEVPLELPAHRVETIFRTNIQGWYAAGRCRAIQANKSARPYLMYSAINDGRTRPAHAAMDGFIAQVDDAIWRTWTPPAGFNCRCTVIGLSEAQAKARGIKPFPGKTPDPGWDYSVCHDGPEEGVKRGIDDRKWRCGRGLSAADPVEHVAAELSALDPWWCRHPALRDVIDAYRDTLNQWDDRNRLLRETMGSRDYSRHARVVGDAVSAHNITLEQGVILRAYTDREHFFGIGDSIVPIYVAMNTLGRLIVHPDGLLPFTGGQLYKIGIMTLLMDEALSALPPVPGTYWRGVSLSGMPDPLSQRWRDAHRKGRVVQYNSYTSVMGIEGEQYPGEWQIEMHLESVRDISAFSVKDEPELVLPRGVQFEYRGVQDGYRVMYEQKGGKSVKKNRNFAADEEEVAALIRAGYTRERAIEILQEMKETRERWARERGQSISEERRKWMEDMYDRMQAEATAGLTE